MSNPSTDIKKDASTMQNALMVFIYGNVQAILTIPVMYGYAAIVFSHPIYSEFMPSLAKLMLFSSFIHAVCFCLKSTIPFAIGQVQDAGLIFLSKIATDIAVSMKDEDPRNIVATSLVTIAIGTACLGLCLILIGRAKLAKFVSYLPMPVIGGYLAYIGLFCLEAGLSLASGKVVSGFRTYGNLLDDRALVLCAPGVITGAMLTWISRYFQHFAVLPAAIVLIPVVFYVLVFATGSTLDDARDYGWLGPMTQPADSMEVFFLYDLPHVNWGVIPRQIPVWIAMVIVVAFSSCLDVAAIEMDMGSALDTNAELITVGMSNFFSGITGGFTGSYIFSQTIFGYRTGVHFRSVAGIMLVLEFVVFLLKVDPLSYVPLFFFAATLIFIAVDLLIEWLIEVREKLSISEYAIVLLTFIAINATDLNSGLLIGIGLSIFNFAVTYALYGTQDGSKIVTQTVRRSITLRHPNQEQTLKRLSGTIVTLELQGAVFFGSSVDVLNDIVSYLKLESDKNGVDSDVEMSQRDGENFPLISSGSSRNASHKTYSSLEADSPQEFDQHVGAMGVKYLVLDCQRLQGVDATAARSCFKQLQNVCAINDIHVCYAGCLPKVATLLKAHGAIMAPVSKDFATVYSALDWCETSLLNSCQGTYASDDEVGNTGWDDAMGPMLVRRKSLRRLPAVTVPLVLSTMLGLSDEEAKELEYVKNVLANLSAQYYTTVLLNRDDILFNKGDTASDFYVLLEGEIILELSPFDPQSSKSIHFHKGSFLGYVDMQLQAHRKYFARALTTSVVAIFTEKSLEALMEDHPTVLVRLLQVMVKQCSLEVQS